MSKSLKSKVWNNVTDQVWDQSYYKVCNQVEDQILDQVGKQVYNQVLKIYDKVINDHE
jgi:hypothetical protein